MAESVKSLAEVLLDVARSDRIGRPVFVRWTATYERTLDSATATVEEGLAATSAIFGGEPEAATRLGSDDAGSLSLLCRWGSGESALIAAGPASAQRRAGYDIALIGNEGAAYHAGERWRDPG